MGEGAEDDLTKLSHAEKDALILALLRQLAAAEARIAALEARLAALTGPAKIPDNSSKPPSQGQKPDRPAADRPTRKSRPCVGRAKARFILATDGEVFEAKDLSSGGDGCLSSAFASDLFHVQARRSDRSAMCHSGFIDVMLVVGHGR